MKKQLLLVLFLCVFKILPAQKEDRLIDSLEQVLKTSKEDTSKVNIFNVLSKKLRQTGDFTKAMSYAKGALSLSEKLDFKKGEVNSYNSIGIIDREHGEYAEAIRNLLIALTKGEKIGYKAGIADSYSCIGVLYYYQGNYQEAIINHLAALKIAEEINNQQVIAYSYSSLGNAYSHENNYSEALKSYFASLKIREKIKDNLEVAHSNVNIGYLYLKYKKWTEAKAYINKGLLLSEQMSSQVGIAASYINMGELYIRLQKLPIAKEYLNKGLDLSKRIRNKDYVREAYFNLSILDSIRGDFRGAYQNFHLFTVTKDSIRNEESERQISQLKIQYETAKKDKEIEILNSEFKIQNLKFTYLVAGFIVLILFVLVYFQLYNKKRKTAFRHQVLETEMKALRSQMNPHFTFNVLNSIQYYIGGNDMKSAELYLNKFSSLIRMILEQSRNAYITLEQEINTLNLYIELEEMLFEKKFDYKINVDKQIHREKILIPGMLIQPIVENAIKHGISQKKGEAMIIITFTQDDNSTLQCTVSDNGIGRAARGQIRGESSHKSVGTNIIKERIEALSSIYNIRLSYKTEDLINREGIPEGTCVSMEIPFKNMELEGQYN